MNLVCALFRECCNMLACGGAVDGPAQRRLQIETGDHNALPGVPAANKHVTWRALLYVSSKRKTASFLHVLTSPVRSKT